MEIISIFGLTVSVILLCSIVFYLYLAYSSKKWDKIDAIVDEVGISKVGEEPLRFKVFINYHYFIRDKKYYSDRIGFFPKVIFFDRKQAEIFLNIFFFGEENISIYVHPSMLKFSVILVGVHNKILFFLGAFISLVGVIYFGYLYFYL